MSFGLWIISCWCLFHYTVIINAATHTEDHTAKDFAKPLSPRSVLSSDRSLGSQVRDDLPEPHRPARSSLSGTSMAFPNRNDGTFWTPRGKRPDITDRIIQWEDMNQPSRSLVSKLTETNLEEGVRNEHGVATQAQQDLDDVLSGTQIDDDDEEEEDDDALWFSDEDNDEDHTTDGATDLFEDGKPMKRDKPFWVARGKKGISEHVPLYWGSNQNVWGKAPLWQVSKLVGNREVTRSPKPDHSNFLSGWESNQNLWGKRNDDPPFWIARGKRGEGTGPYWITRGKRQDSTDPGPYWIARGKRPLYNDQYWGSNPLNFGKRYTKTEDGAAITNILQNKDQPQKRADNGPFWISRGKKSSETDAISPSELNRERRSDNSTFWIMRGKRPEQKNNFWVARGKKDQQPFWVARGKKDSDTSPFWVARGKKDDDKTPYWIARGKKDTDRTAFWVARGKKENDQIPFWIARGKKEDDKTPFWIARGKKSNDKPTVLTERGRKDETNPFWIARGKKDNIQVPFWIARGKKNTNPYWISRGKKLNQNEENEEENINSKQSDFISPFWVPRGRRDGGGNPYWVARGKKEPEPVPFWISRGKRAGSDDNGDGEGDLFWIARGRRNFWSAKGKTPQPNSDKEDRDLLMSYVMETLLGNESHGTEDKAQGLRGKKGSSYALEPLLQTNNYDPYRKGFVAPRGK